MRLFINEYFVMVLSIYDNFSSSAAHIQVSVVIDKRNGHSS